MARPLRIEFPGAIYHVTSRGNAKQRVFMGDIDFNAFLSIVQEVTHRYNWLCYAYCLMPNHYHLLMETPRGNLSEGMRHLNGVYTQWFNRRHERVGHLFQGRFKAILVERQSYLLELCRYVVLNPVRAGLVRYCYEWMWSSYRKTIGLEPKPRFLASHWILANFATDIARAKRAYKAFVSGGIDTEPPWKHVKGGVLLGKESFVRKLGKYLGEKKSTTEIPRNQRLVGRPALDHLLRANANTQIRDKQVFEAHQTWGYSMSEIARFLGVHYATAGRAFRRHRLRTTQDIDADQ